MLFIFRIPEPLYFEKKELRQLNDEYFLFNRHYWLYVISYWITWIKPLSRMASDNTFYEEKHKDLLTRRENAVAVTRVAHSSLSELMDVADETVWEQEIPSHADNPAVVSAPKEITRRLPVNNDTFSSVEILSNDLTNAGAKALLNELEQVEERDIPPPSPKPIVQIVSQAILGSPMNNFPFKGWYILILSCAAFISEIFLFKNVFQSVLGINEVIKFNIRVLDMDCQIPVTYFLATSVVIFSTLAGFALHTRALKFLRDQPSTLFRRILTGILISAALLTFLYGTLYYNELRRQHWMEDLQQARSRLNGQIEAEASPEIIQETHMEIDRIENRLNTEIIIIRVIEFLVISVYSVVSLWAVSMLNCCCAILFRRDYLLRVIRKSQEKIRRSFYEELVNLGAFADHRNLCFQIKLKIKKIIMLYNHHFYKPKNRK